MKKRVTISRTEEKRLNHSVDFYLNLDLKTSFQKEYDKPKHMKLNHSIDFYYDLVFFTKKRLDRINRFFGDIVDTSNMSWMLSNKHVSTNFSFKTI